METKSPETLLTAKELAPLLGFTYLTVYRMAQAGEIPCYRFGRYIRFSLDEVKDALRDNGKRS